MKTLIRYVLFPRGDRFVLQLVDDTGETCEFQATAAQLEHLIDDADALLDADDSVTPTPVAD